MKKLLVIITLCIINCQSVQKENTTAIPALIAMSRGENEIAMENLKEWIPNSDESDPSNWKAYFAYMLLQFENGSCNFDPLSINQIGTIKEGLERYRDEILRIESFCIGGTN